MRAPVAVPARRSPWSCSRDCWIKRSSTVGMPNLRCPPPGFGISTRFTGLGRYLPVSSFVLILGQCFWRCSGSSATVIPSTPGAPRFCFTLSRATIRFSRLNTRPHISPSCYAFSVSIRPGFGLLSLMLSSRLQRYFHIRPSLAGFRLSSPIPDSFLHSSSTVRPFAL